MNYAIRILVIVMIESAAVLANIHHRGVGDSDIRAKAAKLQGYFTKARSGPEHIKYQQLFFEEFPSSFKELTAIYGYEDDTAAVLYDSSYQHLELFTHLTDIDRTAYFGKIMRIAFGGEWDADGISAFQQCLRKHNSENPNLMFDLLSKRSDKEIQSFWYFYFDGPHPDHAIPKEFDYMRFRYPRISDLMEKAHREVLKNEDHGH